jgi:hypothetical protein
VQTDINKCKITTGKILKKADWERSIKEKQEEGGGGGGGEVVGGGGGEKEGG